MLPEFVSACLPRKTRVLEKFLPVKWLSHVNLLVNKF